MNAILANLQAVRRKAKSSTGGGGVRIFNAITHLRAIFQEQAVGGGDYVWRGDLKEGFLSYQFGGGGLYLEGLIFGILRYGTIRDHSVTWGRARIGEIVPKCFYDIWQPKKRYREET